jgi:hypothetical protein
MTSRTDLELSFHLSKIGRRLFGVWRTSNDMAVAYSRPIQ